MALGVLAVATSLDVPPVPGVPPGLRSNLLLLPSGVMEEPGEPGGAGGPLSPGVDEEIHRPGVENPYPGVTDLIGFGDDLIGTVVGDDLGTGVGEAPLSTGITDSPLGPGVGEAPRPEAVEPAPALALLACSSQWGRGGSLLVLAVFGVAGVLVGWLVLAKLLAALEKLLGERAPVELLVVAETVEVEGRTCRPCRALKAASSQSWGSKMARKYLTHSRTPNQGRMATCWPPSPEAAGLLPPSWLDKPGILARRGSI